ncbi:hypothetical protein HLH28_17740 [Gluconacetobacter tumulisoli]|uniref:Uncharacterized protein n=1 Tax=Gluconacetobacter tumulisoli TaxID=1286189 RepID=A0A7W4PR20_9PROT|nr:hypothetical protein [Gluconacetobacter tumulisoli]
MVQDRSFSKDHELVAESGRKGGRHEHAAPFPRDRRQPSSGLRETGRRKEVYLVDIGMCHVSSCKKTDVHGSDR